MKGHKGHEPVQSARRSFRVNPKAFVFFDRTSDTKRFEVKAGADGSLPVDETISLLAMQCAVRGQTPADFRVMVSVGENLMNGLVPRARKLIDACMSTVLPIQISQRQQEVLRGILQNLSNKEIAGKLNVAERTVKFHVSALLQKFNVARRVELMRKAGDLLSGHETPRDIPADLSTLAAHRSTPRTSDQRPKLLSLANSERRAGR